jgi:hypothetical protein
MRRKATDPRTQLLLRELDQAYDKKAWHGTTLRGSLRGLTVKEARWRPARGRHNIWELVLHAAYWKYIVLRKLSGDSELKFPRPGSNFPRLPKKTDSKAWAKDVRLLQEQHTGLRKAVERFPIHPGWRPRQGNQSGAMWTTSTASPRTTSITPAKFNSSSASNTERLPDAENRKGSVKNPSRPARWPRPPGQLLKRLQRRK